MLLQCLVQHSGTMALSVREVGVQKTAFWPRARKEPKLSPFTEVASDPKRETDCMRTILQAIQGARKQWLILSSQPSLKVPVLCCCESI